MWSATRATSTASSPSSSSAEQGRAVFTAPRSGRLGRWSPGGRTDAVPAQVEPPALLQPARERLQLRILAAQLAAVLREPVRFEEVQVEGMFVYQEASTQVHDVEWLRTAYPRLHAFSSWLETGGGLDLCRHHIESAAPGSSTRAA